MSLRFTSMMRKTRLELRCLVIVEERAEMIVQDVEEWEAG
jgi:hypothetical protein